MRDSRCTAQIEPQGFPLLDHHRRCPRNKLELRDDERPHVLEAQVSTGPELAPNVLHCRRFFDPSPILQIRARWKTSQNERRKRTVGRGYTYLEEKVDLHLAHFLEGGRKVGERLVRDHLDRQILDDVWG